MENIRITINGKDIDCFKGETVMEIARKNGIDIPGICYCKDLKPETSCRLCLVEIKGKDGLHTSCDTVAEDGMEVITDSEDISKVRKINLELILSKHSKSCGSCRRVKNCKIVKAIKDCGMLNINPESSDKPIHQFGPAMTFDPNKCINCNNCIQVCNNQGVGYLELKKEDGFSRICPSKTKDCIYCGQCLTHCPSGAFKEVDSLSEVEALLKDKDNHVVFQFSSTLIKSIGKEISPVWNKESIEAFSNFLIHLGAKMVFDTSFGVDMVIRKEIKEVVRGIEEDRCIFTSHCPSWIKYIESYEPEFIPNLSRIRSPHIVSGGVVKDYLIEEQHVDPERLFVISIAPCISKKDEIILEENRIEGVRMVDYVLTTNELHALLKKNKFNIDNYKKGRKDIYIKESHSYDSNEEMIMSGLSTLYKELSGKELNSLEFKRIKGINGAIETSVMIHGRSIRLAIVYGLEGARRILELLKDDPLTYQYLEVMACPGGCLRGGGQLPEVGDMDFSNNIFANFYEDKVLKNNNLFVDDIIGFAEDKDIIFKKDGNKRI
ncbi:MAG: [Fe-Fe] hydrogenase large subunit C-terminal domain-containing protein [Candidatus Pacebacteria bacterium]|nr:[Fe-Fe] hydrogenase large subunit C-terminal domain-containing protein [Candidatus Paceibacterota bacterium]